MERAQIVQGRAPALHVAAQHSSSSTTYSFQNREVAYECSQELALNIARYDSSPLFIVTQKFPEENATRTQAGSVILGGCPV